MNKNTGASDEQIEAAARNRFNEINYFYGNEWYDKRSNLQRHVDINDMADCAEFLVPEGMVIAPAADVLPEHVRDAMQHIVDQHRREMSASGEDFSVVSNWLDRAIADGGAK